ncbi:hypothetical protein T06_10210 [Trichinella sp. T6]|nr:hypothetical protein T06_10210 [Trichinella sp. T6]
MAAKARAAIEKHIYPLCLPMRIISNDYNLAEHIHAFRSTVIQIIFFLLPMANVSELHLVQHRCGGASLVYEGRAYKLKRASRQKYWRCSQVRLFWYGLKRAAVVPYGPTSSVTSVIKRNDHIESCPVDEYLTYKKEKRAVLTKRSAEETKPIPAIYDEEASAQPSTSG